MHFVLVHGAYHGAWCWDELRTELSSGGHASTAVDLPCDDPDAGAERYVDEILNAIPKQADAVVMVGHSLAGLIIPIAAPRGPRRARSKPSSTTALLTWPRTRQNASAASTGGLRRRSRPSGSGPRCRPHTSCAPTT